MHEPARAVLDLIDDRMMEISFPLRITGQHPHALAQRFPGAALTPHDRVQAEGMTACRTAICFTTRQKEETHFLIASALKSAFGGGRVIIAAANDAGGRSLDKTLSRFGVPVFAHSKHKCRVVWTDRPCDADPEIVDRALASGAVQQRTDGMWTCPGLFSWKNTDAGTELLLDNLPADLAGYGADFGCGIGTIGKTILNRAAIDMLYCIDNDFRAVDCTARNLEEYSGRFECRRSDIAETNFLPPLDFVVTNPPFHETKKEDVDLGRKFLLQSARTLKKGGRAFIVANSHLPYETVLSENFSSFREIARAKGFKIVEAVR